MLSLSCACLAFVFILVVEEFRLAFAANMEARQGLAVVIRFYEFFEDDAAFTQHRDIAFEIGKHLDKVGKFLALDFDAGCRF